MNLDGEVTGTALGTLASSLCSTAMEYYPGTPVEGAWRNLIHWYVGRSLCASQRTGWTSVTQTRLANPD